jgi:hypothetical protein
MGGLEQNPKLVGKRQIRKTDSEERVDADRYLSLVMQCCTEPSEADRFKANFFAGSWLINDLPCAIFQQGRFSSRDEYAGGQ